MRLSGIRAYLAKNFKPVSTGRSLQRMNNLEWAFIAVCSLGVTITLFMAWLHHPVSYTAKLTTALLDRLGHHSHIATTHGPSYRSRNSERQDGTSILESSREEPRKID